MLPKGGIRAAALRAAHGWSGLDRDDFARKLNTSGRQLNRYKNEGVEIPDAILDAAADATNIPRWFFDYGHTPPTDAISEELQREITGQRQRINSLDSRGQATRSSRNP